MDWDRAVERNSEALKVIIATLFAMLGDATAGRIPRPLHRAVLGILRPAESALRRLIVIAARAMVAEPAPLRPMPKGLVIRSAGNRLAFQLFDRRKRFAPRRKGSGPRAVPRIHIFGSDPRLVLKARSTKARRSAWGLGELAAAVVVGFLLLTAATTTGLFARRLSLLIAIAAAAGFMFLPGAPGWLALAVLIGSGIWRVSTYRRHCPPPVAG